MTLGIIGETDELVRRRTGEQRNLPDKSAALKSINPYIARNMKEMRQDVVQSEAGLAS